jgi:hypothetical protein
MTASCREKLLRPATVASNYICLTLAWARAADHDVAAARHERGGPAYPRPASGRPRAQHARVWARASGVSRSLPHPCSHACLSAPLSILRVQVAPTRTGSDFFDTRQQLDRRRGLSGAGPCQAVRVRELDRPRARTRPASAPGSALRSDEGSSALRERRLSSASAGWQGRPVPGPAVAGKADLSSRYWMLETPTFKVPFAAEPFSRGPLFLRSAFSMSSRSACGRNESFRVMAASRRRGTTRCTHRSRTRRAGEAPPSGRAGAPS